jgi:SEC-C motif
MAKNGRNAPCPCGSGRKHKHCCLARAGEQRRLLRTVDAVWRRLQERTIADHPAHLDAAIDELLDGDRRITPRSADLLCSYAHLDRELPGGGTPAERFATLPALTDDERAAARSLSRARLGLWRARAVRPGVSIELEEVIGERVVTVESDRVSRSTARWDVLLCRVIDGPGGRELWGPAAIFGAAEEVEIVAEVERLAKEHSLAVSDVFRARTAELLRFSPPSRSTPPSFFTFEGDEVVTARARWTLTDHAAALADHPDVVDIADTDDGEGVCLEWTAPRSELAARRPMLPPRAMLLEGSPVFFDHEHGRALADTSRVGLGTFEVRAGELTFHGMSAERLEGAVALVAETLGHRARLVERHVEPIEFGAPPAEGAVDDEEPIPAELREAVLAGFMRERFQRMLDEPDARFDGLTPREAARSARHRPRVERWLRTLENAAGHGVTTGEASPDVATLRDELGMPDVSLAHAA